MSRIQFGLIIPDTGLDRPNRHAWMGHVRKLLDAVSGRFTSVWSIDHLQGDMLEGWTAVSYLAALYPAFIWGHTVLSQPLRNPALLAKMGATLQFITGGRFALGIGAGGQASEHRAYGYPFPPGAVRVAQLDEALQIIRAMWTEERTTFAGAHFQVSDARCEPKPESVPPIYVGAFGPKMLRLTARHADGWNVSSTGIAEYRDLAAAMARACEKEGRDPATVRRVWSGGCVCAPTEREVTELAAARLALGEDFGYEPGIDFMGTPSQLIEQMGPFIELGVDTFLLDCGGFPRLTTVELLADEVLPALNR